MAFRNFLSLLTVATTALILSANTESVNALSIESHGHHVSRHVLHDTIAKKRRSAKRCRQRPTSTAGSSSAPATTAGSKTTTTSKAATTTKASSSGNSGSGSGDSGSGDSGSGGSGGGSSGPSDNSGLARGLAWAVDNNFAPTIAKQGGPISWLWHWADGPVSTVPYLEFVPCFWGTSAYDKWNQRVAEMKQNQPQHVLGFNEPDIDGQANMSPGEAASVWMDQIHPWGQKGVKLVSPQIAFDQDWLGTFINNIQKQGGWVDVIALHWYGSYKDIASFKSYVTSAHSRFNKPIWVTELGITTASGANEGDCLNFMKEAIGFLESTGYVQRVSWFGAFTQSAAPDGFATGNNALFYSKTSLTSLGQYYSS